LTEEGVTLELSSVQIAVLALAVGVLIGGFGGFAAGTIVAPAQESIGDFQQADSGETNSVDQTPEETFRQISKDLEIDTDTVMQCYQESNNEEANEDKRNAASKFGGFGTPTFFVGNRDAGFVQITGAQPLSRFEDAMDTVKQDNPNSSGDLVSMEGIEFEGEPSKGESDALIKVIEYNEFGCPFCAEWQGIDASGRTPIDRMNIAGSLESQYVEAGEVEFISKDYPVPQLHPNGPKAHQAANCVYKNEQDSYWEFHDELFERRDQWMAG
jgi:protein-disulfide isomerase